MVKRFFSIPVPLVGSVAMLLLCTVFFLLPFALRGAKLALADMQNNVADWLPDDYPETQELAEFRKYFFGDQFAVVSGPWCKEGNPAYINLVRKIREESLEYEKVLNESQSDEEIRAHQVGDEYGLMYTGNYHEDWGQQREKWLKGSRDKWYFINRNGELFRWDGQNNVVDGSKRVAEKFVNGYNVADGTYITKFGPPPDDENGIPNPFYANPQKLCCRPFKSVVTGPMVFDQMAGEDGTLRIGKFGEEDLSTFEAKIEAHKRLTGAVFGPTPADDFNWTFASLLQNVDATHHALLKSNPVHQERFEAFVKAQTDEKFDGDFSALQNAVSSQQLELWYRMWFELDIEPPPRQTCLIVTLNKPILKELARAVGRPLMGKPRGRILELATGECGIAPENLHIGGPPSDNVAIDEEGTSTLLRLVGLSGIIGFSLAYMSFGSIRVACMLFFVAGVAAISSLSYVWFGGTTMDAILMSMPSLVYVLGLSGAVHIVNYYREACYEHGSRRAVEIAVMHSLFPCALASFTTALGLISLTTSNLTPIYKFGLFSAIATLVTVILLFTYLPSALTIWPVGYKKKQKHERDTKAGLTDWVGRVWEQIGEWVLRNHWLVSSCAVAMVIWFCFGIAKIQTSVHLLKLFDPNAKILQDYRWMEENLGELVPAELVINIDQAAQQEAFIEEQNAKALASLSPEERAEKGDDLVPEYDERDRLAYERRYSMLERVELSSRVRNQVERFFGPDGLGYVGSGMSTDVFTPLHRIDSAVESLTRKQFSGSLFDKRDDMLEQDYLAVQGISTLDEEQREIDRNDPERFGREMWRVSIRLAALSDVDYGEFIGDLKSVVEPVLTAYRSRSQILNALQKKLGEKSMNQSRILVLGRDPDKSEIDLRKMMNEGAPTSQLIDQTHIFADTLQDLFENRGIVRFSAKSKGSGSTYKWLDPAGYVGEEKRAKLTKFLAPDYFKNYLVTEIDCVVLIDDDPLFDVDFIKTYANSFVDCRDHEYKVTDDTRAPLPGMKTAMERKQAGEDVKITAIYTGIIPIVYKAQRALLWSLIESIGLAFVMIMGVMMLLLRDWKSPLRWGNALNFRGGLISMLPNVFPVVIVFGFMGHRNILVDIGSMMTASVAMGVAVDDTIHFLTWYRQAIESGLKRLDAIRVAYSRVATAMTQTTLIGGLGLSAFALSTFTPTQRFGTLMLFLLAMALIGDLILLPALLAGPLGKYFCKEKPDARSLDDEDGDQPALRVVGENETAAEAENESGLEDHRYDVHPDSFKHQSGG
jgi:predicted RND superfamily exporter protein